MYSLENKFSDFKNNVISMLNDMESQLIKDVGLVPEDDNTLDIKSQPILSLLMYDPREITKLSVIQEHINNVKKSFVEQIKRYNSTKIWRLGCWFIEKPEIFKMGVVIFIYVNGEKKLITLDNKNNAKIVL